MRRTVRLLVVVLATLAAAGPMEGQAIIDRMKDRARQQAQGRVDRAADEAVDSVASKAEATARCLISDALCIAAARDAGQPILITGPDGQPVASEDSAAAVSDLGRGGGGADAGGESQPSAAAPAARVATTPGSAGVGESAEDLAAADFAADALGAPPTSVQVHRGTFTVEEHEVEDGRWMTGAVRGGGSFFLQLPRELPPVFTVTFQVLGGGGMIGVHPSGLTDGAHAMVETSGRGLINDGLRNTPAGSIPRRKDRVLHHAKVVGRDSTLVLYIDDTLVAQASSADLARRGKRIAFGMGVYGSPVRIGAIRVVEGAD
jgi:hypothetical protein